MRLFDDIVRTEGRPRWEAEPSYIYYNTSARPGIAAIRDLLEEWFDRFPAASQADLCGRFRSPDEAHHEGAFFELYIHELACKMGFELRDHPDIPGSTNHPDFLAVRGNQPLFFLEATIAASSATQVAAEKRQAEVYDCLNRMVSPNFFLLIEVEGAPATPPPAAKLRRDLERWLAAVMDHLHGRSWRDAEGSLRSWLERSLLPQTTLHQ